MRQNIIKLFASSWYIFLTYIYDARSHLYQISLYKVTIIKKIKRIIRLVSRLTCSCTVIGSPQYFGSSTGTLRFPVIESPANFLS